MKIDLRKLFTMGKLDINEDVIIPSELFSKMNVIRMDPVHVEGSITVNFENNIELNLKASGNFIMPCAISLEEVPVDFSTDINEIITENSLNDEFFLDLLDILWENIVLEIPIRVVKEGTKAKELHGDGWELDTEK